MAHKAGLAPQPSQKRPEQKFSIQKDTEIVESVCLNEAMEPQIFDWSKYSSFRKQIKTTAYCFRGENKKKGKFDVDKMDGASYQFYKWLKTKASGGSQGRYSKEHIRG